MLAWVGCHIDAYEQARWFGDDRAVKHAARFTDIARPVAGTTFLLSNIGRGGSLAARTRAGIGDLSMGIATSRPCSRTTGARRPASPRTLGLPPQVKENLAQTFERWDGRGEPDGLRGNAVLVASRLVALADVVDVYHAVGGADAAVQVARSRRGSQFDPTLVDLYCAHAEELLDLGSGTSWELVRSFLPRLDQELDDDGLDHALGALADFANLKSPYTLGHSRAVADLADAGGADFGLDDGRCQVVRRAGLVHDLGRLGVPNSVWDRTDPLTPGDAERIRMHPYFAERMFASVPPLAPLATLASYHHERLDGSGSDERAAHLQPPGEDIGNPLAAMTYSISLLLHCMTVSLAEGGAGLGTGWGEELAISMLADAGFGEVAVHDAPGDPGNAVFVTRA